MTKKLVTKTTQVYFYFSLVQSQKRERHVLVLFSQWRKIVTFSSLISHTPSNEGQFHWDPNLHNFTFSCLSPNTFLKFKSQKSNMPEYSQSTRTHFISFLSYRFSSLLQQWWVLTCQLHLNKCPIHLLSKVPRMLMKVIMYH